MATTTRFRGYTRPARGDPARIEDTVGRPLDDIDADVDAIDSAFATFAADAGARIAAIEGGWCVLRAGSFYRAVSSPPAVLVLSDAGNMQPVNDTAGSSGIIDVYWLERALARAGRTMEWAIAVHIHRTGVALDVRIGLGSVTAIQAQGQGSSPRGIYDFGVDVRMAAATPAAMPPVTHFVNAGSLLRYGGPPAMPYIKLNPTHDFSSQVLMGSYEVLYRYV